MKILVLGHTGQLGRCLNDKLENTDHEVIYTSSSQINISDLVNTKSKIMSISPDAVINAAAYTAVDMAEKNKKTANLINNIAVKNIANICNKLDCWLVHISTDYVFDGKSSLPYKEGDETNPLGVYGKSKLDGELAIKSSNCKNIIIRTSWLYSEYGNNFLKTMLNLGTEMDELNIIGDQYGCPTYAQDLAEAILKIIPQLDIYNSNGLYHYCGDQWCSWFDFANDIFKEAKTLNLKTPTKIKSIESSAYPSLVKRPLYSALDCSKIKDCFDISLSDRNNGIRKALASLNSKIFKNF